MSSKSDYLENALLNAVLRNTSYTSPATVYCGLFTVSPTDANTGTEVSGNGYNRKSVAFDAPSGGVTQNTSLITFDQASGGNWGAIIAIGLYDASSAGNLLYWTTVTSQQIDDGDTATIAAAAISITET
jgi:hypothetical protein